MKKMTFAALWLLAAIPAGAQTANLLKNGSFAEGAERNVPGWEFSPSSAIEERTKAAIQAGQVAWGVAEKDGVRSLGIAVPAPASAHAWWSQKAEVDGGASYVLAFRAKGTKSVDAGAYASVDVGVFLLDASGKWIGFLPVPDVGWTADWKEYRFPFSVPDNAAKAGVRLGGDDHGGVMEIRFAAVSLEEAK